MLTRRTQQEKGKQNRASVHSLALAAAVTIVSPMIATVTELSKISLA